MDGLSEDTVFLSLSYEVKGPGQRKMNRKTDVCFTVSRHLFKQAKNFRKLVVSLVGEMKVSAEQMRLPFMTDAFFFLIRQIFASADKCFFTTTISEGKLFSLTTGEWGGREGFLRSERCLSNRQVQVREIFQAEAFQNRHVTLNGILSCNTGEHFQALLKADI